MEIALWIVAGWLGLTVAITVWVGAFIRRGRNTNAMVL